MEGGAAAAIQVLVQNLINVSKEEISLIRGLEKDADKLMKTLPIIQGYSNDAGKKLITEEAVKNWLKDLEVMAFEADNVLDELHYDQLSKKMNPIKTEKRKVPSCFPCFNDCKRRREMALRIREINTKFKSTIKLARDLGLESKLENAHAAPDAGPETDSLTLDPIFIGRDNDVSTIVEMLITLPTDQLSSILPIVGMGGMGKTTLTRNVFNQKKIKTHFVKHMWVHVSKNFDPVSLLKKILSRVASSENDGVRTKEGVLERLQEALKDKTYLLVLDDVWNEDQQKWEDFLNSLLGITSAKGNAIIVTTRNKKVGSIVSTLSIYEIKGLPEDSCWSIIKEKSFGKEDVPSGFETIGRNIAKKCDGLPLAANVVGGVLRGKSEDDWLSIEGKWLSDDENNISKILKLSFENLSSPSLKKCFACCSVFPKGYSIDKEELIELWMAEGFLQIDQKNDMAIVGNKFLELLLQNSLLQVKERDFYGNIEHISMHDSVHDLARVIYYGRENDGDESSHIPKYLRTLFCEGEISTIMFSNFKCLRVLVLTIYDLKELPSSIRELMHLRYLDISRTKIDYLSDWIGELYHLQTLRADTSYLEKLPNTLICLISLRHLHLHHSTRLPLNIGSLTSLQTLKYFKVENEEGHRMSELGSLKNLKGDLHIFCLEKVRDKEEAENAYLFQKSNIVKLDLRWNESRESRERETNDENVLEGLQPHPNLKRLKIFGFNGTRFPLWTMKMEGLDERRQLVGLDNLMALSLEDCRECEAVPMLGHLQHLNKLKLSKLRNVKVIDCSFYGIDICSSNNAVCKETMIVFPALKRLILENLSNLTEWVDVKLPNAAENRTRQVKIFPCLQYLRIYLCQRLRSVPRQFSCLKELYIEDCEGLINLPDLHIFNSLEVLDIRKCPNIKSIPYSSAGQLQGLTSLRELRIWECEGLINLPDLHIFNSLEELYIIDCPNIKSIPYSSAGQPQGLTSLRELRIWYCEGLINLPDLHFNSLVKLDLVWCSNIKSLTYSSAGQSQGQTSLRNFRICYCEGLIDLPDLHNFNSLEKLDISDCPNIKSLPYSSAGQTQGLTSLRELRIWYCEGLINLPDLHFFNSLAKLDIVWCPNIKSIPYSSAGQSQGLTSLRELTISNCEGLINLPDMHIFNSLTKLDIGNCPNIKSIPYSSAGQSQGLISLCELRIWGCKGLINLPYKMIESCLSLIRWLWLENLSSITNISMIINSLYKMHCLETLKIIGVPIIIPSSPMDIGSLRCLRELSIGPPLSSRDCVYFNKAVDGILRLGRSQSIRSLYLSGMEDWDSFPDELQHLTALSYLKLKNFGIEELPEWFGNLKLLEESVLAYCKKLKHLPSAEAMRRLTKLRRLYIYDCPALKERCIEQRSDDHDSEWPKISHIPEIWFDGSCLRAIDSQQG